MSERASSRFFPFLIMGIIIATGLQMYWSGGDDEYLSQWTPEMRQNAVYFIQSLELVLEATAISNRGGPGVMREEEVRAIASLWREALNEAEAVRDDVLDLIHPELRGRFRSQFAEGLRLRLLNVQTPDGDLSAEVEGSRLLEAWGDWYTRERRNIRVPRP